MSKINIREARRSIVMLEAAQKHFESAARLHNINMTNYLQNSCGIGNHADIMGELIDLIEKISHASSSADFCLSYIKGWEKKVEEEEEKEGEQEVK